MPGTRHVLGPAEDRTRVPGMQERLGRCATLGSVLRGSAGFDDQHDHMVCAGGDNQGAVPVD